MQAFDYPPKPMRTWPADLTFSPDGRFLVVAMSYHQVLDTAAGAWAQPFASMDHKDVRFALGGRAVAYRNYVKGVTVADFATRAERTYTFERASVRGLAVTPDGGTLFALAHLFDAARASEVWAFDAATLERRARFAWQKEEPWLMVGSADGRRLATGQTGDKSEPVTVWDTTDHARPPVVIRPKQGLRFALSADGAHLATVGTKGVVLWDAAAGRELWASAKHRRGVAMAAFSPARPLLATGDKSGIVFLWDFAGRVLARYDFGLGKVSGLTFAPDGLRLAAAGEKQVVIWDLDV